MVSLVCESLIDTTLFKTERLYKYEGKIIHGRCENFNQELHKFYLISNNFGRGYVTSLCDKKSELWNSGSNLSMRICFAICNLQCRWEAKLLILTHVPLKSCHTMLSNSLQKLTTYIWKQSNFTSPWWSLFPCKSLNKPSLGRSNTDV